MVKRKHKKNIHTLVQDAVFFSKNMLHRRKHREMKDGSLLIDHRKKKTCTKRRNNIYKKTYTERKHHRKNKYIRSVN
jgi:hypothetical protein